MLGDRIFQSTRIQEAPIRCALTIDLLRGIHWTCWTRSPVPDIAVSIFQASETKKIVQIEDPNIEDQTQPQWIRELDYGVTARAGRASRADRGILGLLGSTAISER